MSRAWKIIIAVFIIAFLVGLWAGLSSRRAETNTIYITQNSTYTDNLVRQVQQLTWDKNALVLAHANDTNFINGLNTAMKKAPDLEQQITVLKQQNGELATGLKDAQDSIKQLTDYSRLYQKSQFELANLQHQYNDYIIAHP